MGTVLKTPCILNCTYMYFALTLSCSTLLVSCNLQCYIDLSALPQPFHLGMNLHPFKLYMKWKRNANKRKHTVSQPMLGVQMRGVQTETIKPSQSKWTIFMKMLQVQSWNCANSSETSSIFRHNILDKAAYYCKQLIYKSKCFVLLYMNP